MLVCDTSGLLAFFDASDRHSVRIRTAIEADPGPFVVSPYVVAELDYLLATRRGVEAELAVLKELSGGAWELPSLGPSDLREAAGVIERYADQELGVADASLVVLARRYGTDRLLTLDHRHFRVIQALSGRPFRLVPEA